MTSNLYKSSQLVSCARRLIINAITKLLRLLFAFTFISASATASATSCYSFSCKSIIQTYYTAEKTTLVLLLLPSSSKAVCIIQQSSQLNVQLYQRIVLQYFCSSLNSFQLAASFFDNAYYLRISLYQLIATSIARLCQRIYFQLYNKCFSSSLVVIVVAVNLAVLTKLCFDLASTSFQLVYYSYRLISVAIVLAQYQLSFLIIYFAILALIAVLALLLLLLLLLLTLYN